MKQHQPRTALTRIRALLITMGLVLVGIVGVAAPASAATGNILPPFDTGTTWTICRGYDYASHTGTSEYGIDLTGSGCDNSAAGRNVRAPIDGTVYYYQASYGNLCVNIAGNRSYTLTHIDSSVTSGPVTAGQLVGSVAAPNTRNNAGVAHIHFQIWGAPNCYNSSVIPFDSAHNTQICGAPDLTPTGGTDGFNNGMWSGTVFTGQSCGSSSNTSTSNRIGVLNSSGSLDVKEGPVGATWTTVGGGTSFELSPNRVALYDGSSLNVKEGGLGATWTTVTGQVDEYHVTDNRVGIRIGTQIFVKEGPLNSPWVHVADGNSFAMSPNRLAVYNGSALNIKEGNIYAGWTTVTGQVDEYHITDNRIGIRVGTTISIKDGPLGATWTTIGSGSSFQISPNRIAMYDGQLNVKEGPANATWTTVTGAVDAYDVTDNRVGILISGQLYIKDGPINSSWVLVGGGSAFDLS